MVLSFFEMTINLGSDPMTTLLDWTNHGGIAFILAFIAVVTALSGIYERTRPVRIIGSALALAVLAALAYSPKMETTAFMIYVVFFFLAAAGVPLLLRAIKKAPAHDWGI